VAVCKCGNCGLYFWRFRRDWPPKGMCSFACNEQSKKLEPKTPPDQPQNILLVMYAHRRLAHNSSSILAWFPDCEECERLEASYSGSLQYHYAEEFRKIAENARTE